MSYRDMLRLRYPVCIASLILLAGAPGTAAGQDAIAAEFDRATIKRRGIDTLSQQRLLDAQRNKAPRIACLIESAPGRNAIVASRLVRLGGHIVVRADDIDYIRGDIPTSAAMALAGDTNVLDVSLGGGDTPAAPLLDQREAQRTPAAHYSARMFLPIIPPVSEPIGADPDKGLPALESSAIGQAAGQRPDVSGDSHLPRTDLPLDNLAPINPWLPTYLMGVPQFLAANPTFDGRGVTIAVLSGNGDPDHPMLQSARALDGTMVAKTIDFEDPARSDAASLTPAVMAQVNTASDGRFQVHGETYVAPRAGTYRFATIQAAGPVYAVLWNEVTNLVWVDIHRTHDFRTAPAITDYALHQQVLRIPGQDPGFHTSLVVKTYPVEHVLKLFMPTSHETQVASVAAGGAFLGSQATGVAPAARVIYVMPFRAAFVESFLVAARDPRVDLITCSFDIPGDTEGESVIPALIDRIIARYGKPIAKASGNAGAVVTSIEGVASASRVLTVGTYSSRQSERANTTSPLPAEEPEYVNRESGSGPGGLGNVKPDLVAPSPSSRANTCDAIHVSRSDYRTIRCYFMGDGQSSMAAPMVAGLLADLISAAKQTGVAFDAERLRFAVVGSARHVPRWPIDRQGGGVPDIAAAWSILKSETAPPVRILSEVPISRQPGYSRTPGIGVGLYESRGWPPGTSGVRDITLYRTNGPTQATVYRLTVIGDDSTFSAPADITLPLARRITVPVRIQVTTNGVHSALLRLSDARDGRFAGQFGMTVIAADRLEEQNQLRVARGGVISRNRDGCVFVDVPAGLNALDVTVQSSLPLHVSAWRGTSELAVTGTSGGSYTIDHPEPGVVELLVTLPDDLPPDSVSKAEFQVVVKGIRE
jgi:hypothetical protein